MKTIGISPSEVTENGLGMVLRFLVKQLTNHLGKNSGHKKMSPKFSSLAAPFQILI